MHTKMGIRHFSATIESTDNHTTAAEMNANDEKRKGDFFFFNFSLSIGLFGDLDQMSADVLLQLGD